MAGLVALDDRSPRTVASPGSADRLHKELVRALRGTLVGEVERDIGGDDPDECDRRDVEALADEARPDEHVEPAVGERVDHALRGPPSLDDVAVEPPDTQAGNAVDELALDAFRPTTEVADAGRRTGGTAGGDRDGGAAMVAAKTHPGLVEDEGPIAFGASLDGPTVAAQDHRGGSAPVDDEDRLLTGGGIERAKRREQGRRQEPAVAGGELGAQVDKLDLGQSAGDPLRERESPVGAEPDPSDRLHGGRRAPENDGRPGKPAECDRRVASLEPWRAVALVGRVVLLVDDEEPDVGQRGEHGEACPDHDIRPARADPAPLVRSLPDAHARVDERHANRQLRPEAIDERQGERDLGYEDDRAPTAREGIGDGRAIHGGLPAPSDAVEERRGRVSLLQGAADDGHCGELRGRQGAVVGPRADRPWRSRLEGITRPLAALELHESPARETCDRPWSVPCTEVARPDRLHGLGRRLSPTRCASFVSGGDQLGHPELLEERHLSRPERASAGRTVARRGPAAGVGEAYRPLETGARARFGQRPFEMHAAGSLEHPEATDQRGTTVGRGEVPHGPRPVGERGEQVRLARGIPRASGPFGAPVESRGDELGPFEQAGGQHRPDHDCRRGEILRRDPSAEGDPEGRQQRPVGAHPRKDRLRRDDRRNGRVA